MHDQSGIAIIQIDLLRSNGEEVGRIHTGETGPAITNLHASESDITLMDVTDEKTLASGESFRVSVKIINTTVDIDVLHKVRKIVFYTCAIFLLILLLVFIVDAVGPSFPESSPCSMEC